MKINYSHRFVSDVILFMYVSNVKLKNNQSVYKKMTLCNTIRMQDIQFEIKEIDYVS